MNDEKRSECDSCKRNFRRCGFLAVASIAGVLKHGTLRILRSCNRRTPPGVNAAARNVRDVPLRTVFGEIQVFHPERECRFTKLWQNPLKARHKRADITILARRNEQWISHQREAGSRSCVGGTSLRSKSPTWWGSNFRGAGVTTSCAAASPCVMRGR